MTELALFGFLSAAAWALAWWDSNRRRLNQRTTDFAALADKHDALVKEHGETIDSWQRRFDALEQSQEKLDAKVEQAIRNIVQPQAGSHHPLGVHYGARG